VARLARQRQLIHLPPRVAFFFARARRLAARRGDAWSLRSATGPRSLAHVLREAHGHRRVVEIGTGTAWASIASALADDARQIVTYDPVVREAREWYLELAGASVRSRIALIDAPGEAGPADGAANVGFVYIDGSHDRDRTIATFEAWHAAVAPGGAIAFHDWRNESYPGVTEAILELGLPGQAHGDVFVWRKRRAPVRAVEAR
jgi:predicted O-methyltransferase YrrM